MNNDNDFNDHHDDDLNFRSSRKRRRLQEKLKEFNAKTKNNNNNNSLSFLSCSSSNYNTNTKYEEKDSNDNNDRNRIINNNNNNDSDDDRRRRKERIAKLKDEREIQKGKKLIEQMLNGNKSKNRCYSDIDDNKDDDDDDNDKRKEHRINQSRRNSTIKNLTNGNDSIESPSNERPQRQRKILDQSLLSPLTPSPRKFHTSERIVNHKDDNYSNKPNSISYTKTISTTFDNSHQSNNKNRENSFGFVLSSSDDDDDLNVIATRIHQRRQQEESHHKQDKVLLKRPKTTTRVLKPFTNNRNYNSDSDSDDLNEIAQSLIERKQKLHNNNNHGRDSQRSHSVSSSNNDYDREKKESTETTYYNENNVISHPKREKKTYACASDNEDYINNQISDDKEKKHSFDQLDNIKIKRDLQQKVDLWDDSDDDQITAEPSINKKDNTTEFNAVDTKAIVVSRRGRKGQSEKSSNNGLLSIKHELKISDLYDFGDDDEMEKKLIPEFSNPKWPVAEFEPLKLQRPHNDEDGKLVCDFVPASINRYLAEYQRQGVQFMHSVITQNKGVILGDDMGLGKTVQVISLLAALQQKSGTMKDLQVIKERQTKAEAEIDKQRLASDEALLKGKLLHDDTQICLNQRPFAPVLIIAPPSVMASWDEHFQQWGHFSVASFGNDRLLSINRIKLGTHDILLYPNSLIVSRSDCFPLLFDVEWKLVVIDEFHSFKNDRNKSYQQLCELRNHCKCPILGLTGTVMQNNYKVWLSMS